MELIRSTVFFLILLTLFGIVISDDYCMYTIFVKTGTVDNAGTDSKISVELYDETGRSIQISDLERWGGIMKSGHDYYENGNLDAFKNLGLCLRGPVCKMTLTSDGKNNKPGWFVNYVEVASTQSKAACFGEQFVVNRWLAENEPSLTTTINNCKNRNNKKLQDLVKSVSP